MLQLHGIPVPVTALPRVPTDSSSLRSSGVSGPAPAHSPGPLPNRHQVNVQFMSSTGSRRIYARNGGSGTVASVHQFELDDMASSMEADDYALQSTLGEMEAAVGIILQEIGEDIDRPVCVALHETLINPCFLELSCLLKKECLSLFVRYVQMLSSHKARFKQQLLLTAWVLL